MGVVSDFIKQYVPFLTEPLVAVAYGVLIGPAGLGLFRVATFGNPMVLLEQASRLTLGVAVMVESIALAVLANGWLQLDRSTHRDYLSEIW